MSQRNFAGRRKAAIGVLAAIALYAAWTLATWLLEGRIETLLRPDAAGDRAIYAIIANLLIGVIAGVIVLRHLICEGILTNLDSGFGPATRLPIRLTVAVALGVALYVLQGAPSSHPMVLINGFAQILVVSAAEVMVCWAIVGAAVEAWLRPRGRATSLVGAALVASTLFGVYHVGHSPPFNTLGMVVLLTAAGLVTSMFFFLSRDVYATILFHNFLGLVGVTRALEESGQLGAFELLRPSLVGMAIVTVTFMALLDWTLLRRTPRALGSARD